MAKEFKEFVVIYDWGGDKTYHEFDTLEEAVEDRNGYTRPKDHPIYQRVRLRPEEGPMNEKPEPRTSAEIIRLLNDAVGGVGELAARVGCHVQTVHAWKQGRVTVIQSNHLAGLVDVAMEMGGSDLAAELLASFDIGVARYE